MTGTGPRILLASASPRRAALLRQIGLHFEVAAVDIEEEKTGGLMAAETAVRNARGKALRSAAANGAGSSIIIAADTIVVCAGQLLGKPVDRDDAVRMLSLLRGREHRVITGLAIVDSGSGRMLTDHAETIVIMADYSAAEIHSYVASGEPMDKAGAYGIQGRAGVLVKAINGSYSNVVGLPLELLRSLFIQLGYPNLLTLCAAT
ncbi:septum formation protein Maf [bacterium]|nr:septum formation protein Maf [candidate division CSSED10-310 bacterium]